MGDIRGFEKSVMAMAEMGIGRSTASSAQGHPTHHEAVITAAADLGGGAICFALESATGQELAGFEAGSIVPLFIAADDTLVGERFTLASSPAEAHEGVYRIIVKSSAGGYVAAHMLANAKAGSRVLLGEPEPNDLFRHLDAGDSIIAIAGGTGIAPFRSLAKAIAEGAADYRMTLFYRANEAEELLFRDEWTTLEEQSNGMFCVVPVLSSAQRGGYEQGPITREMIERYADPARSSCLICAPGPMVAALRKELSSLGLPRRRLRFAFSGDTEFNHVGTSSAEHSLTIHMGGETYIVPAREDETILTAIEKAGLRPASYCRCGICGFCESMLSSGIFVLASDEKGVRHIRERNSYIHPCCTYPRSDMELVVPRAK